MYPPSLLVRGAMVLGICAMAFAAVIGWRLISVREAELLRYSGCSAGTRTDCAPSFFWMLAGLARDDGSGRLQPNDVFTGAAAQKRIVRTSDASPVLTSVKPEGFIPEGRGYSVAVGERVTLTVTVENAKRVEARFLPAGTQESNVLAPLLPVEGDAFTYRGTFSWNETRGGDLEILALDEQEKERTQMFLPLRIQSVADKR